MSSTVPFCTIAKRKLNNPDKFLPSGIRFDGEDILWIKPAHASWKDMEETPEILASKITGVYDTPLPLPSNMERMANDPEKNQHQKEYIDEYTSVSKILRRWLQNYQEDAAVTDTVSKWMETCDNLTQSPYFTNGWNVPAFYPLYSHQCWTAIDLFFSTNSAIYPRHAAFWIKQQQLAESMFSSWEPTYFGAFAGKKKTLPQMPVVSQIPLHPHQQTAPTVGRILS